MMKFKFSIKNPLTPLSISIILLIFACNKDELEKYEYIKSGCIPAKITLKEPTLGGIEDIFQYDGACLASIGPSKYKYSNGLVSEIWTFDHTYVKFFYNSTGIVIRTEVHRIPFREEEFELVAKFKYIYSEKGITEIKEYVSNKNYYLYYNLSTNNLDSMLTFDESKKLIRKDIYKHDAQNNIYYNLKQPAANYLFGLQNNSGNNNVTEHSIFEYFPNNRNTNTILEYRFEYNSFGYPVKRIQGNATWHIEYLNCK